MSKTNRGRKKMHVSNFVENLPTYDFPECYRWKYKDAVSVEDIGFPYVLDCLHKKYSHDVGTFPPGFDTTLLYRLFRGWGTHKIVHTFIEIDPEKVIMAQRYVGKGRLLEIAKTPNPKPARWSKYGDYYISHDGHHRTCLNFIRGSRMYTELKVYDLDF